MSYLPRVLPLKLPVRDYSWGSRTALQQLFGFPDAGELAAEVWIGAHAEAPAHWVGEGEPALTDLIKADPNAMIGAHVEAEFGPRLPFLLKLLAAEEPLSLQVHPHKAQAQEGWERENALGIPRFAANRNYKDGNHKPELFCALTPFEALCSFRPVPGTLRLLSSLGLSDTTIAGAPFDELLSAGLRPTVETLFALPEDERDTLIATVGKACADAVDAEWAAEARTIAALAADNPHDAGVVLALLLNLVRLRPGEAIFLSSGQIHSYQHGVGVEILANSDNVVRCGLTPKHVDVPELLRITDFTGTQVPVLHRVPDGAGVDHYEAPVRDFRLSVLDLDGPTQLTIDGPFLILCTEGTVTADSVSLGPAQAVYVRPGGPLSLDGKGILYVAALNPG